jgi:hypothetical protein
MPGRRDRDELGRAFDQSQQGRLQQQIRRHEA